MAVMKVQQLLYLFKASNDSLSENLSVADKNCD